MPPLDEMNEAPGGACLPWARAVFAGERHNVEKERENRDA